MLKDPKELSGNEALAVCMAAGLPVDPVEQENGSIRYQTRYLCAITLDEPSYLFPEGRYIVHYAKRKK